MNKLKIGQIIYRYVSYIPSYVFRFEVIGIHQYKDVEQYHVKCLSCTHGKNQCEMLVGYEGKELRFIQMLNNRGDVFDEPDETHWHSWGELFYTSRSRAIFKRLEHIEKDKIAEIEKAKQNLKRLELDLEKIRAEIESHKLLAEKEDHDKP